MQIILVDLESTFLIFTAFVFANISFEQWLVLKLHSEQYYYTKQGSFPFSFLFRGQDVYWRKVKQFLVKLNEKVAECMSFCVLGD